MLRKTIREGSGFLSSGIVVGSVCSRTAVGTTRFTFGIDVEFCSETKGTSCDVCGNAKEQVFCKRPERFLLRLFVRHQFVVRWQDQVALERLSTDAGHISAEGASNPCSRYASVEERPHTNYLQESGRQDSVQTVGIYHDEYLLLSSWTQDWSLGKERNDRRTERLVSLRSDGRSDTRPSSEHTSTCSFPGRPLPSFVSPTRHSREHPTKGRSRGRWPKPARSESSSRTNPLTPPPTQPASILPST